MMLWCTLLEGPAAGGTLLPWVTRYLDGGPPPELGCDLPAWGNPVREVLDWAGGYKWLTPPGPNWEHPFRDIPDLVPARSRWEVSPLPEIHDPMTGWGYENFESLPHPWLQHVWTFQEALALTGSATEPSAPPGKAPQRPAEDTPWWVREFVADGLGQAWGLIGHSRPVNLGGPIVDFEDLGTFDTSASQWQRHPCTLAGPGAHPQRLAALSNGRVICLWSRGKISALTLHRGTTDQLWCTVKTTFTQPRLQSLPDGGLAITEQGTQVARISADGATIAVDRIPDRLIITPARQKGDQRVFAFSAPQALKIGDNSLWLWSYSLLKKNNLPHLAGFVSWTPGSTDSFQGQTKEQDFQAQPFGDGSPISAVVADGEKHLFVALAGAGLKRLHWPDGKVESIDDPDHAFAYIQNMTHLNGALHLVTCPEPHQWKSEQTSVAPGESIIDSIANEPLGRRTGALWRLDGMKPRLLLQGLDARPSFSWVGRPLLALDNGLMVGAVDLGPWWLPAAEGAKPFLLDRTQGYNLGYLGGAVLMDKHRLLVRSTNDDWAVAPLPGDKPRPTATRMVSLFSKGLIVEDLRHHMWARRLSESDLAEWDGTRWRTHDMPATWEGKGDIPFEADSHDHGWALSYNNGKTPVLDFATGKWHVFDTLEQATAERLVPGDQVFPYNLLTHEPMSHVNGIKAFIVNGAIHVFREGRWTATEGNDITGPHSRGIHDPRFDANGILCVTANEKRFELRSDGQWVATGQPAHAPPQPYLHEDHSVPQGCTVPDILFPCRDRFGVTWITTKQGGLWKWLDGVAVQVRDKDGTDLLRPCTHVRQVLIDTAHNALLRTNFERGGIYFYHVLSTLPPPPFKPATLAGTDVGSALIYLATAPGLRHRWQVDHAEWHPLARRSEIKLQGLSAGAHQVNVQYFDPELTPLAETQTLAFTIKAASTDEITLQIQQLHSQDLDTREAAAHVLRAQGPAALPALQQALQAANDDASLQWWLTAIIQHIKTR